MRRVLLWLYTGCVFRDVAEAVYAVRDHAEIEVVGPRRGAVATSDGIHIRASGPRRDAGRTPYVGVLIPGGDVLEVLGDHDGLRTLAKIASAPDVVVGAVNNGTVVLGAARLLQGRRITHPVRPPHASPQQIATLGHFLKGAVDSEEDLVTDGNWITATGAGQQGFAAQFVQKVREAIDGE